jgi:hypothetical protein
MGLTTSGHIDHIVVIPTIGIPTADTLEDTVTALKSG